MKDKNIGAPFGVTDNDLIEGLGLNPSLKGQDTINQAAKAAVQNQMVTELMAQGMSEEMARSEAKALQAQRMK